MNEPLHDFVNMAQLPAGATLNPFQEALVPLVGKRVNVVVQAQTAAGKTAGLSMLAHSTLFETKRKKLLYVAPMKALVEEKKRDWTAPKHPYKRLGVAILTGDYAGAARRDAGDPSVDRVVVVTPEAFASRLRNAASNEWISDVGYVAIDEAHFVGAESRGAALEAAMLEFSALHPQVPLALLSGTIPNHGDLADWVDGLNDLPTETVVSAYRPTALYKHYIEFPHRAYAEDMDARTREVIRLARQYSEDSFLVVVFSKTFGYDLERALNAAGIPSEFHNADKDRLTKSGIEARFLEKQTRVLVCTTTLTTGMNMPARRVIVTNVKSAGGDVPAYDLLQAAGRAGRPAFDPQGDAYFFVPQTKAQHHISRIENGERVESQLGTKASVALHFLGALHTEALWDRPTFVQWFERTLFHYQHPNLSHGAIVGLCNDIVADMNDKRMLRVVEDSEGEYFELRRLGTIAVQMSIDPYHLDELCRNWHKTIQAELWHNDHMAAKAFAEVGAHYDKTMNAYKMDRARNYVPPTLQNNTQPAFWDAATAYFCVLSGKQAPYQVYSVYAGVKQDFERLCVTMARVDAEVRRWDMEDFFKSLALRASGIDADTADVMAANGLGKSKARLLRSAGYKSVASARSVGDYEVLDALASKKRHY